MKKIFITAIAVVLLATSCSFSGQNAQKASENVDFKTELSQKERIFISDFDESVKDKYIDSVSGIIKNSRMLVPFDHYIFDELGFEIKNSSAEEVQYISSNYSVTIQNYDNNFYVYINDNALDCDVPPIIIDETLYVPLRAICEGIGAEVIWNAESKTATIIFGEAKMEMNYKVPTKVKIVETYISGLNMFEEEYNSDNSQYAVYDFDSDGTYEMLVFNDDNYTVYSYDDGIVDYTKDVDLNLLSESDFYDCNDFTGLQEKIPSVDENDYEVLEPTEDDFKMIAEDYGKIPYYNFENYQEDSVYNIPGISPGVAHDVLCYLESLNLAEIVESDPLNSYDNSNENYNIFKVKKDIFDDFCQYKFNIESFPDNAYSKYDYDNDYYFYIYKNSSYIYMDNKDIFEIDSHKQLDDNRYYVKLSNISNKGNRYIVAQLRERDNIKEWSYYGKFDWSVNKYEDYDGNGSIEPLNKYNIKTEDIDLILNDFSTIFSGIENIAYNIDFYYNDWKYEMPILNPYKLDTADAMYYLIGTRLKDSEAAELVKSDPLNKYSGSSDIYKIEEKAFNDYLKIKFAANFIADSDIGYKDNGYYYVLIDKTNKYNVSCEISTYWLYDGYLDIQLDTEDETHRTSFSILAELTDNNGEKDWKYHIISHDLYDFESIF